MIEQTAYITYRIVDREVFARIGADLVNPTDADVLVEAMLTGRPPLDCGYEIVRVEP